MVTPLLKGHGHQSFVVRTASRGALLLKIALRAEQLAKMQSLRQVLELTARHRIPAPRLLHFAAATTAFGGRPWLVQEFFDGEDGEVALTAMSPPQRAAFFRDFGAAVARLHAIDPGFFAEELAPGRRERASWQALVEDRVAQLIERHQQATVMSRAEVDRAPDAILSSASTVSGPVRAALVHRDLYLPNTLVADGRFRCLLDFEHARSTDAVADFVKLRMWVFEEVPGAQRDFLAGYGADPVATEEGPVRYRVALGLELLSGLAYWQKTGQPAMLADYRRRLAGWLTGGPDRRGRGEPCEGSPTQKT